MVQFRKSKKVGPFRFTVSQRGISASAGAGPLRISRGADGKVRRTVRIPGTGIYDVKVVGQQPQRAAAPRNMGTSRQPGWYPDPYDPSRNLFWNGTGWGYPPQALPVVQPPTQPVRPPKQRNAFVVAALILGAVFLFVTCMTLIASR